MAKAKVYNLQGKEVDVISLNPEIFEVPLSEELLLQALHVQRTNARETLAHTKTRSNVRGGGKKPWKQKGTGRARAGSIRSPLWIGGGIIFGPLKERNYSLNLNRKMRKKAILMALSDKVRENSLIIVDDFNTVEPKTKEMVKALGNLKIDGSVLLTAGKKSANLKRASANLKKVELIQADSLNLEEVLKSKYMVVDAASLPIIEKTFKIK